MKKEKSTMYSRWTCYWINTKLKKEGHKRMRKWKAMNNMMKIFLTILGFLNGGYMLVDGVYVTLKGKFIGMHKPGPWANLFYKLNMDVFKLGPLFITFGILWLIWVYALCTTKSWAYIFGLIISLFTLWYLPLGTLFSITIFISLMKRKSKLGM